jgi:hypothetical protein
MKTPTNSCPACGKTIGLVTDPLGREVVPKTGNFSICWGCEALLQYNSELVLLLADENFLSDKKREDVKILRTNMRIMKEHFKH